MDGYARLVELVSRAYLEGRGTPAGANKPLWLAAGGTSGLIALTGAGAGPVDMALKSGSPHWPRHA